MTSPDPSDAAVTEPPPWTDALIATLKRDDLCEDTDGEHHTDDYIAAVLIALDTELRARKMVAANVIPALPSTPVRPDPGCADCRESASGVCTMHNGSAV